MLIIIVLYIYIYIYIIVRSLSASLSSCQGSGQAATPAGTLPIVCFFELRLLTPHFEVAALVLTGIHQTLDAKVHIINKEAARHHSWSSFVSFTVAPTSFGFKCSYLSTSVHPINLAAMAYIVPASIHLTASTTHA